MYSLKVAGEGKDLGIFLLVTVASQLYIHVYRGESKCHNSGWLIYDISIL